MRKLTEASVEEKLEALLRKSLFQLAVSMAKSARQGDSVISDIHLRYGDHLYEKGDYDGAVAQYQKTLGWVQPSHVIRKVSHLPTLPSHVSRALTPSQPID